MTVVISVFKFTRSSITAHLILISVTLFAQKRDIALNDSSQSASINTLSIGAPFSDHMVLQQNNQVSIWGKGLSGATVSVTGLWGKQAQTIVDQKGDWKLQLQTPDASFNPQTLMVSSEEESIVLSDILIGEVWLCSGQSNMHFRLKFEKNGDFETSHGSSPHLRLLNLPTVTSKYPKKTIAAHWLPADSTNLSEFSAVAYYFGKELMNNLKNTPIGLINASYGSSTIEAFMSNEALQSKTYLHEHLLRYTSKTPQKTPSAVYNAMIHPLLPLTIKGIIWYQGESNVIRASQYEESLRTLIKYRRREFQNTDLPFMIVQIPGYAYSQSQQEPGLDQSAAILREAQERVAKNTALTNVIVTSDIGDVNDLHPKNKKPIGKRLAATVLNQIYGQSTISYLGPKLVDFNIDHGKAILSFDHAQNGFQPKSELNWFMIAGEDKVFYQGNAFANGNTVTVSSPFVETPVAIRFAWHNEAVSNFVNLEGLPAAPFRTDSWLDVKYAPNITFWQ